MFVIIDRFEGNFAVCQREDGEVVNIERNKIPSDAREGDVFVINGNIISIDYEETLKRKKEIEKMTENLWE